MGFVPLAPLLPAGLLVSQILRAPVDPPKYFVRPASTKWRFLGSLHSLQKPVKMPSLVESRQKGGEHGEHAQDWWIFSA